jgi:nicotinate dehydrogenase subunit A
MSERIALRVNGEAKTLTADPDMPLLYALRNDFGLNNPHFGCGLAQCGACTVLVDDTPIRSCATPVNAVADRSVTTLEGLSAGGKPHPVQQAFIDEEVPQCGYCLSGWVMTAVAFLKDNPKPSDADIREAFAGLKCRCGTHVSILRAIKRAAGTKV